MVREGLSDVPLVVESAQVFDTHHVALLVAAGASAVVPYLADQFAESLEPGGTEKVRSAINAGLRKVLARMGVSTLASYRNSHLFEIVGLSEQLCSEFFEDAADYPGLKSLDDLLADYLRLHKAAFSGESDELPDSGLYRFRKGAELHASSPEVVRRLHAHVRAPSAKTYSAFEELAEHQGPVFLRDLLDTVPDTAVPLDEVEPLDSIVKRFSTQAMSLGSLGPEAHRTLALAMNQLGGRSNTGEGGEDPQTYRFEPAAATKSSKSPPAALASPPIILFTPKNSKSRWPKARNPAKAANCPRKKSASTSRASATPLPAPR